MNQAVELSPSAKRSRSREPITENQVDESSQRQEQALDKDARKVQIQDPFTSSNTTGHPDVSATGATRRARRRSFLPKPQDTVGSNTSTDAGTETSESTRPRLKKFGGIDEYWSLSDEEAKQEDEDLVKGMKQHLDNLLIFAGLFSAINSGFLALSIPSLNEDPSSGTNSLLVLLIHTIDNSTTIPENLTPSPFKASFHDIKINLLFSISLTLSLLASSGAPLAQQWLVSYSSKHLRPGAVDGYKRLRPGAVDSHRWDRERKYAGANYWRLEEIIEIVFPTLLQGALLVFMIGFITFLHDMSGPVALPNLILGLVGLVSFVVYIIAALWDPFCPFQAPITGLLRPVVPYEFLRPTKSVEKLQVESVGRTIENSDNLKLLTTTAANIPLLSASQIDLLISAFPTLILSLFGLYADTDEGSEEQATYARALTHLQVADRTDYDDTFYQSSFTLSTKLHLNAPDEPLATITSSVACVGATYLATSQDDSTADAKQLLHFLKRAIPTAHDKASAVGMVARVISARSERKQTDLNFQFMRPFFTLWEPVQERTDWNQALRTINTSYRDLWTDEQQPDIALTYAAEAITGYSPDDEPVHELMLSIMSGAGTLFNEAYRGGNGAVLLVKALGSIFTRDKGYKKSDETGATDDRWDEVVDRGLVLMSKIFDRLPTDTQVVSPKGSEVASILGSDDSLRLITAYVETLGRRHDPNYPRSPGSHFYLLFAVIRTHDYLQGRNYVMEFIRAAASLPPEILPLSGKLAE